jgi:hypothetical protein
VFKIVEWGGGAALEGDQLEAPPFDDIGRNDTYADEISF